MQKPIDVPTNPPKQLGPKQKAWIAQFLKPAQEGAERVAAAEASARRAREIATGHDQLN